MGSKRIVYSILITILILAVVALLVFYGFYYEPSVKTLEKKEPVQISAVGNLVKIGVTPQDIIVKDSLHRISIEDAMPNQLLGEITSIKILIQSTPLRVTLDRGEPKEIDLDNDDLLDIRLIFIGVSEGRANVFIIELDKPACEEDWKCSDWTSCDNGERTRVCSDKNNCETVLDKPDTEDDCVSSPVVTECKGWDCFIDKSKDCELSNLTDTVSAVVFGANITSTTHYKVSEEDSDLCEFEFERGEQNMRYTYEAVQQFFSQGYNVSEVEQLEKNYNDLLDSLEGTDSVCFVNSNELYEFLSKLRDGNLNGTASCDLDTGSCDFTGDWAIFNNCVGDYFMGEGFSHSF